MGEAKRRREAKAQGLSVPERLRPLRIRRKLGPLDHLILVRNMAGAIAEDDAAAAVTIAEDVRAAARQHLLAAGARGRVETVIDVIDALGADALAAYEDALAQGRRTASWLDAQLSQAACRKGCSWCCHLHVDVTVFEAIHIHRALEAGRIPDRRAAILAAAAQIEGLGALERQIRRIPCPLLMEGACSAYEVRPLACRALVVPDATTCERDFAAAAQGGVPVPSYEFPYVISSGYTTGQIAAMDDLGLPSRLVELTGALDLLARDPQAIARWLNGHDPFPHRAS